MTVTQKAKGVCDFPSAPITNREIERECARERKEKLLLIKLHSATDVLISLRSTLQTET